MKGRRKYKDSNSLKNETRGVRALTLALLVVVGTLAGVTSVAAVGVAAGNGPVTNTDTGASYQTIQGAIDDASAGETVEVRAGTYAEVLRISEQKADITLTGAGEGETVIDASSSRGYGMTVKADGVTLDGFTLQGSESGTYGIKAADVDDGYMNDLTVRSVTVTGFGGTELDVNGVDGVTITDVTLDGAGTGGNGLSLTNVQHATMTDIDTTGNDWGGVAVYTTDKFETIDAGTNVILFEGDNSFDEANPFYIQADDGTFKNVDVGDEFEYGVHAPSYRDGRFAFYQQTKADAVTFAQGIQADAPEDDTLLYEFDGNRYLVPDGLDVQTAIDQQLSGGVVEVMSGTYDGFTIDKPVTVRGAEGATPTVTGDGGAVVQVESDGQSDPAGATLDGFEITGSATLGVEVRADGVTVKNNDISVATTGVQTQDDSVDGDGVTDVSVTQNTVSGGAVGVSMQGSQSSVSDNTIEGVDTEGIGFTGDGHSITSNTVQNVVGDAPGIRLYGTVESVNGVTGDEQTLADSLAQDNADAGYVEVKSSGTIAGSGVHIGETPYKTIQAAIDAAANGDTIDVDAGTYTGALDVPADKTDLTVRGAGQDVTTIDARAASSYGIAAEGDGTTLEGFTLLGPNGGANSNYGIKAQGSDGEYVSVTVRDVTVEGSSKSELDFNGVEGGLVEGVTADGQSTGGVGIAITDSKDVTLRSVTTTGNDWGGVGIYAAGKYSIPAVTDGVTVEGDNTFDENLGLYVQEHGDAEVTDVTVNDDLGYQFAGTRSYTTTPEQAAQFAVDNGYTDAAVQETATGDFVVVPGLSVQAAVDAASPGDTVDIGPGTYTESVTIDEAITLRGAGSGETVIAPDSGSAVAIQGNLQNVGAVDLEGMTLEGDGTSLALIALSNTDGDYDTASLTATDVAVNANGGLGVGLFDVKSVTLTGVTVDGATGTAAGALEVIGVGTLDITDSTVSNNDVGVYLKSVSGYESTDEVTLTDVAFENNGVNVENTLDVTVEEETTWCTDLRSAIDACAPIEDATVSFDDVLVTDIDFSNDEAVGQVLVTDLDELGPDSKASIPGPMVEAVDITVPDAEADESATVTFELTADDLADAGVDADSLVVAHYDAGADEWTTLDTTVETDGDAVTFEAETPGFSTFALVDMTQDDSSNDGSSGDAGGSDDSGGDSSPGGAPSSGGDSSGGDASDGDSSSDEESSSDGDASGDDSQDDSSGDAADADGSSEDPDADEDDSNGASDESDSQDADGSAGDTSGEDSSNDGSDDSPSEDDSSDDADAADDGSAVGTPEETSSGFGPGFGVVVALLAFVGAALLAARREN